MAIIRCKMCGSDLNLVEGQTVAQCEYCGSTQTVPTADNEKKLIQFERAERLRRNCEFDKAYGLYEAIISEFRQEAEAYWGLLLCKFGIEYVDDPGTGKKIPTCHRSSFDSVMDDSNLELALENADVVARRVYREEAKRIEQIRRDIISVSSNEEPYDIFICYKETDPNGSRTLDSVLAQDLYDTLTGKGYRVFFARISLEDKLGQAYEPYIFAALNSAKIMLAVGTDYEYFNAVWVKNEWSRFLKLMTKDKEKHLIPCYKGIDAYDMPKEFARLQAQDMGKVGAMQDLLRGIEKILPRQVKQIITEVRTQYTGTGGPDVDSLMRRAKLYLENCEWPQAMETYDKILDIAVENADAHIGKLCAQYKVTTAANLANCSDENMSANINFRNAMRFAAVPVQKELEGYAASAKRWAQYRKICQSQAAAKTESQFRDCAKQFRGLGDFQDSAAREKECLSRVEALAREAQLRREERLRQEEQERARKEKEREEHYLRLCEELEKATTSREMEHLAIQFYQMGDYRDARAMEQKAKDACVALKKEEDARREAELRKIEQERRKKKKRTIIITVAVILGIILAIVLIAVYTTVIMPAMEKQADYDEAQSLIAAGDFDGAMDIYQNYDDQEMYLQTWYAEGMWYMEQEDYLMAGVKFAVLADMYGYADSAEQEKKAHYLNAVECEGYGNYDGAANNYADAGDYADAREGYLRSSYLHARQEMEAGDFDEAAQWFAQAEDHEDARNLAIYCQARDIGEEDLMQAKDLLLQLPREMEDVDVMLTALETYGDWCGSYSWKTRTGNKATDFTSAELRLIYKKSSSKEAPVIDWEVVLWLSGHAFTYNADGAMPQNGKLEFTDGVVDTSWEVFVITKTEIRMNEYDVDSRYGWMSESSYLFERS